ncbi:MAG: ATP-binding protein [Spirochaetae bacterium HGW-Spirochaetae-5]|nr:MAG: ATP-binding protein [Spirochaetae bacterium HGW-Spirochaetae-5]
MNNEIRMSIKPEWENIEAVRVQTGTFLKIQKIQEDVMDAVIMNISELLENAIKYGNFNNGVNDVLASVSISERDITVEVKSPVKDEDDRHFRRLDKIVQWVRGYQNPFEAYIEKIKEVSLQPIDDNQSGLGIVRIAYEGQSIIDFFVNDDNIISVSAVYHLSEPGRL